MKETLGDKLFLSINKIFCFFIILLTAYPFIYVVSMSISDPENVVAQKVWFLPKGLSFEAYTMLLQNPDIWAAYFNTIWYAVVGTCISVVLTLLAAYPLSRKNFFLRKQLMFFIAFTMFFSGGMIPMFILVQNLGMYNTRWAIVIPGAVAAWYVIMARTFFQEIPDSLYESAKVDGAGEMTCLTKIFIPLSKPIVAVLVLFYAVGQWNSYFSAMIYLPDKDLQPLQLFLMKVLIQNSDETLLKRVSGAYQRGLFSIQLKYAVIIISILPIMLVYPFLQKYFVKGVMVGAIKG